MYGEWRGAAPIPQKEGLVQSWDRNPAELLREGLGSSLLLPTSVLRARGQSLTHHDSPVSAMRLPVADSTQNREHGVRPRNVQSREVSHLAQSGKTTSNTSGGTPTCGEGKAGKDLERRCLGFPERNLQTRYANPVTSLFFC